VLSDWCFPAESVQILVPNASGIVAIKYSLQVADRDQSDHSSFCRRVGGAALTAMGRIYATIVGTAFVRIVLP